MMYEQSTEDHLKERLEKLEDKYWENQWLIGELEHERWNKPRDPGYRM